MRLIVALAVFIAGPTIVSVFGYPPGAVFISGIATGALALRVYDGG